MKAGSSQIREQEAGDAFRAMADAAPAPIWMTSADGGVTFINRAFLDVTGLAPRQLLGDAWTAHMHPEDVAALAERRAAAAREGHAPYEFAARFRDALGVWRWVRASAQPRFGGHGEFQGYVGLAVDETAARSAIDDLRASESRLRLVQAAGRIGSFDWDMRTGQAYRSPEYLELQGLPSDTPLAIPYDDSWMDRLHPDDREAVVARFRQDTSQAGCFELEYRIVRADDGETRWIHSRGRVEAGPDGAPSRLVSAQTDITRQKQLEFELRAARDAWKAG